MPDYDGKYFEPAAPVAYVTLRSRTTGLSLSDLPMLIDTGADISMLPREQVTQLDIEPNKGGAYEIQGFDGEIKLAEAIDAELVFLGKKFKGQFLLIDGTIGILGRNILNEVALLFDGPNQNWAEFKR